MEDEANKQDAHVGTEGDDKVVGTLSDLDKADEVKSEEPKKETIEVVKKEEGKAEEPKKEEGAELDPKKEEIKDDKPDGLVTDDVVKKAQTEGIESLNEEEKKHLMDEGILKKESEVESTPDTEFKGAIEKITGEELDVDFGDTPMNTPEGLAKYVDAYADKKIETFEDTLAERFPQAYKALQIESEGGNVTEYFKSQQVEGKDYSSVELSEDDALQHKQIIRTSYKLKGIDDDTIDEVIKIAEDNNKLKEKANPELNYLKSTQNKQAETYAKQVELQKQQDMRIMQGMVSTVDDLIGRGEIGNFTIPKADKTKFLDHLKQNIEYKDGEFFVTKRVTPDTLEQIAQAEFFNYKEGNLSKYIKSAADTKLVLDLKARANKDTLGISSEAADQLKGYTPLGDM